MPTTSKSGSVTDTTSAAANAGSSGTTNGGEEMKDLWIFHYSELPDLSASISSELRGNSIIIILVISLRNFPLIQLDMRITPSRNFTSILCIEVYCSYILYGTAILMVHIYYIVWHCSLTDRRVGSWEEGMSTEATGMFFRALRNLSER